MRALREALSDAYDGWLRDAPARATATASRWSRSAASAGANRRRTPTWTWCCCTTGSTAASPRWPTRSGTRSGTAGSAWTTRCARPSRRSRRPGRSEGAARPARPAPRRRRRGAVARRCAAQVVELWRATRAKRVDELRGSCRSRAGQLAGEGAFLLEPNLKDSRGGLRDAQSLRALALAQLSTCPRAVRTANTAPARRPRRAAAAAPGAPRTCCGCRSTTASRRRSVWSTTTATPDRDEVLRRVNHRCPQRRARARRRLAARRGRRRPPAAACAGCSASPPGAGAARASRATSSPRTARSCWPATPTRAADPGLVLRAARAAAEHDLPLRRVHPRPAGRPSARRCPSRGRTTSATTSSPCWAPGAAAVPVLESLDLGRAAERADPRMGRRALPRPAQPGAPLHRRPAPARDRGAGRRRSPARSPVRTCCSSARCCTTSARATRGDHSVVGAEHAGDDRRSGWASPTRDVATITALSCGTTCCCPTPRPAATSTTR